jgi:hypothetical protein
MVATERFSRVTGWIGASGQESAFGRAATLQAVTRVKLEQASKVKLWMPTRPLFGEGRAAGKETDKHLTGPPG